MRSELEIPFELADVGIESKEAICVEIVARTRAAVKIRRRITRTPKNGIEFGVKRAGHPGGATAEFVTLARPTGRAEFAGAWNVPETPRFLAGLCVIGRDK